MMYLLSGKPNQAPPCLLHWCGAEDTKPSCPASRNYFLIGDSVKITSPLKHDDLSDRDIKLLVLAIIREEIEAIKRPRSHYRNEAIAWVFGLSPSEIDFETACFVADLSAKAVRESMFNQEIITRAEVEKVRKIFSEGIDKQKK